MNPRNRRAAREAIDNILLCCAGGGEMVKLSRPEVLGELRYLLETVWKSNFGRPTPSTRHCLSDGVEVHEATQKFSG